MVIIVPTPPPPPSDSDPYNAHLSHHIIHHVSLLTSSRPVLISPIPTYISSFPSAPYTAVCQLTFSDTGERWAARALLTPSQCRFLSQNMKGRPLGDEDAEAEAIARAKEEVRIRERMHVAAMRTGVPRLFSAVRTPGSGLPPLVFCEWRDGEVLAGKWERAEKREREVVLVQVARWVAEGVRACVKTGQGKGGTGGWSVQKWFEQRVDERTVKMVEGMWHPPALGLSAAQRARVPNFINRDLAHYPPALVHDLSAAHILVDKDWNITLTSLQTPTLQPAPLQLLLTYPPLLSPFSPSLSPRLSSDRAFYTSFLLRTLSEMQVPIPESIIKSQLENTDAAVFSMSVLSEEGWAAWAADHEGQARESYEYDDFVERGLANDLPPSSSTLFGSPTPSSSADTNEEELGSPVSVSTARTSEGSAGGSDSPQKEKARGRFGLKLKGLLRSVQAGVRLGGRYKRTSEESSHLL